jgi:uncharacterized protein YjbI with pentapeptide repeats
MEAKMAKKVKAQHLGELRNPENMQVLRTLRELKLQGWLQDGTLEGMDLRHVHFQRADLENANLKGTDLRMAHLQMANLTEANLCGACLSSANLYGADLRRTKLDGANLFKANLQGVRNIGKEQLTQVKSLWGATMPDGTLYDGCFNLQGDIEFALAGHVDIHDPRAMSAFYRSSESVTEERTARKDFSLDTCNTVQLIRKLRSSDNYVTRTAVDELRMRGHLEDGSLQWVYLRYVNLQGVDLSGADLRKTDLNMSKLQGTDLSGSNLKEARLIKANLRCALLAEANLEGTLLAKANLQGVLDVTEEQLARAGKLRSATMPDGSLYDGRFNLAGDLADARFLHVNIRDPQEMAAFYGVSLEKYELGQTWIRDHKPLIWNEVFARMQCADIEYDMENLV